ncbi:MAG TPA: GYD domain-containing protein [Aliidongia sp.]|nr:GYD domain-containing protein [Aliidongia sp.]
MTTYILLGNYTDQGARQVRESPARLDKTRAMLREMGGNLQTFNLTMGRYDFVAVYEAPDDAVAARFTLMLGAMGNVRTETLKAFPETAYREIIHSLGA